jgi:dihydrofolate reductase
MGKILASSSKQPLKHRKRQNILKFADETQKIVISNSLDQVEWKNSILIKDNIVEEIQKLRQQPGKNLIVAGGATVAQTFAKLGLIDEYLIVVHPVILGKGKLLLKDLNVKQYLKLNGTKTYNSGAVELSYSKIA